jgi:uncharacterized protein (TIGR02246 family)
MTASNLMGVLLAAALVGAGIAGAAADRSSYADERAAIEDLQARYLFALDWQDPEAYSATFTDDGVLDWAGGITRGRDAIRADVRGMRDHFAKHEAADAPLRPARLRHFITNVVVRIDGDRATSRAYWFELNDDGRDRRPYLGAYGHYEDELRKVSGQWLFSKRKIYNEQMESRAASAANPAG